MAALPAVTPIMRSRSRRLGEDTSVSFGIATSTMKKGSRTRAVGELVMRDGAFITRSAIAIKAAASPRPSRLGRHARNRHGAYRQGPLNQPRTARKELRRSEAKGPAPFGRAIGLPR